MTADSGAYTPPVENRSKRTRAPIIEISADWAAKNLSWTHDNPHSPEGMIALAV
jgi:hypothetical protein